MKELEEIIEDAPQEVIELLEDLKHLKERNDYHPEPNTYMHIKIVTERLSKMNDPDLIMAGVFHDLAKMECVRENPKTGNVMTPGHEKAALKYVDRYALWIESKGADVDNVRELVEQHMRIKQYGDMRETKKKQMREMKTYKKLVCFTAADNMLKEFYPDYWKNKI